MSIKARLQDDMKTAMKARDSEKLGVIRFIMAAIKQQEIDKRIEHDDVQTLAIIEKLAKQHKDSIAQFESASRKDLVEKEQFELSVVQQYLPEQLPEAEIEKLIKEAIAETGAETMRDMGNVMAILKPKLQGRADMGMVSGKIKSLLS